MGSWWAGGDGQRGHGGAVSGAGGLAPLFRIWAFALPAGRSRLVRKVGCLMGAAAFPVWSGLLGVPWGSAGLAGLFLLRCGGCRGRCRSVARGWPLGRSSCISGALPVGTCCCRCFWRRSGLSWNFWPRGGLFLGDFSVGEARSAGGRLPADLGRWGWFPAVGGEPLGEGGGRSWSGRAGRSAGDRRALPVGCVSRMVGGFDLAGLSPRGYSSQGFTPSGHASSSVVPLLACINFMLSLTAFSAS